MSEIAKSAATVVGILVVGIGGALAVAYVSENWGFEAVTAQVTAVEPFCVLERRNRNDTQVSEPMDCDDAARLESQRGNGTLLRRYNLGVRYTSPVDGAVHEARLATANGSYPDPLTVGASIQILAHTSEPGRVAEKTF